MPAYLKFTHVLVTTVSGWGKKAPDSKIRTWKMKPLSVRRDEKTDDPAASEFGEVNAVIQMKSRDYGQREFLLKRYPCKVYV